MPFCPKCRYEYKQGMVNCPDCDERLVSALSKEAKDDDVGDDIEYKDWVLIATLTSQQYAAMCLEGLRAKDIPAVLHSGTGHFGLLGQMGISSYRPIEGNYKVFAPKEFAADARHEARIILGDEGKGLGVT